MPGDESGGCKLLLLLSAAFQGPYKGILIGLDDDKEPILLRVGPYGLYLQKGEGEAEGKTAKRVALPQDMDPEGWILFYAPSTFTSPAHLTGISLETARAYLSLPRVICHHPETGSSIQAGIGRYGTFLLYQV